ncbi:MAG TPA: methyltransferase domain-containing protein [Gemmatimonadaceae bacterium]|nr:methyltransferase domain-containing protein [Gemmatimonadaceae bacterium]
MIWRGIELCCPSCRDDLEESGDTELELRCRRCESRFPVILGIPDLRVFSDPYVDVETDRAKGRKLAERFDDFDFAGLVEHYYRETPVVTAAQARAFTGGQIAAEARARATFEAWEGMPPASPRNAALLEIGCGTGPMLLAARDRYAHVAGIDIAFRWLVVGKKRLLEAGADVPTICACAEALPFPDARVDVIVGDAVIENVKDQVRTLSEAHRVLRPGGRIHLTTSNRFSLGPDAQTGIWAAGWLPRGFVEARVRRSGAIPPRRTLFSAPAIRSLLRGAGFGQVTLGLPSFPAAQRAQFPPLVRQIAALYELTTRLPLTRQALFAIGPKLMAGGVKGA